MLADGEPVCTGTAITKQWIISASHCFFEQGQAVTDKRISFRAGNLDMRKGTLSARWASGRGTRALT
jgi:hypothetical protein